MFNTGRGLVIWAELRQAPPPWQASLAGGGITTDAKLAELISATGRATQLESYHVWNLYKRVLTALQCCPTTEPTAEDDSVSASKSKCGSVEYGTASVPPVIYQTGGWSGTLSLPLVITNTVAGSSTYDASCALPSPTGCTRYAFRNTFGCGNTVDILPPFGFPSAVNTTGATYPLYEPNFSGTCVAGQGTSIFSATVDVTYTPTTQTFTATGGASGSIVGTLSNPYLTPDLISTAIAALPSFDGDWDDTAGSYYFLSTEELTFDIRRNRRRWSLSGVAGLTNGRTYRLKYVIRFQPAPSGSPTDGAETYLEFTFTTGMTHTPYVTVPDPTTNGTNMAVWTGWACPSS